MKDHEALPPILGGKGDLDLLFAKVPVWDKPAYFDLFYCAMIGYHLEGVFLVLFTNSEDKVEMTAHHTCTCMLILFSHYVNCQVVGTIILFIHHVSDIFCSAT